MGTPVETTDAPRTSAETPRPRTFPALDASGTPGAASAVIADAHAGPTEEQGVPWQ